MLSVASCSSSRPIRKRRNSSDDQSSGIKVSRGESTFYFVLESESEVTLSSEDAESIISLQNKSTDFAKDTSDTSSKTSNCGSADESLAGVEYEVVSLSEREQEKPFDSYSSSTDSDVWKTRVLGQDAAGSESGGAGQSVWADGSASAANDPDPAPTDRTPRRTRPCIKCKMHPTLYQYCYSCYKVRKDFFLPRPKNNRKKKSKSFVRKKSCVKEPPKLPPINENESASFLCSSSQEFLTPTTSTSGADGVCNVCSKNPKNGAFLHCSWVHIYACYQCSLKIWFYRKRCPLCNGRIRQVLKVAMG